MSGVIKSQNHSALSGVRPFAGQFAPAEVVLLQRQDEERERLRRTVTALQEELSQRDSAIEALHRDVTRALETGESKGRAAGLAEAQDLQRERLAALESQAGAAQKSIAAGLSSLDRLAALLARECVEKILGGDTDRAALVRDIVATQLARIEKSALLRIEVSRADFPDDEALAALTRRLPTVAASVEAHADMATGACTMVFQLGRVEVGIGRQWGELSRLLDNLSQPDPS